MERRRRRVYVFREDGVRIFAPRVEEEPLYVRILCPAFIPAMASLSPRALPRIRAGTASVEGRGWMLDCSKTASNLGPFAVKTLLLAYAAFTARPHGKTGGKLPEGALAFSVSAWDASRIFGVEDGGRTEPSPYERTAASLHDLLYRIRDAARTLAHVELALTTASGTRRMPLISECAVKGGSIEFKISPWMGAVLVRAGVAHVHEGLFTLSWRERTAFALGLKMDVHASIRKNHEGGSWNRLRVKSLLEATPLPMDLKAVANQKAGKAEKTLRSAKGWRAWTQEPFSRAMGLLKEAKILDGWSYSPERTDGDFQKQRQWLEAVVEFTPSKFPQIDTPKDGTGGEGGGPGGAV